MAGSIQHVSRRDQPRNEGHVTMKPPQLRLVASSSPMLLRPRAPGLGPRSSAPTPRHATNPPASAPTPPQAHPPPHVRVSAGVHPTACPACVLVCVRGVGELSNPTATCSRARFGGNKGIWRSLWRAWRTQVVAVLTSRPRLSPGRATRCRPSSTLVAAFWDHSSCA